MQYLVLLLPATVGLYAVLPQKPRRVVLLRWPATSFWAISGKLIAYLLFSTLSVHHIGLWLEGIQAERDRRLAAAPQEERKAVRGRFQRQLTGIVAFGVMLHLGLLLLVKYTPLLCHQPEPSVPAVGPVPDGEHSLLCHAHWHLLLHPPGGVLLF